MSHHKNNHAETGRSQRIIMINSPAANSLPLREKKNATCLVDRFIVFKQIHFGAFSQ